MSDFVLENTNVPPAQPEETFTLPDLCKQTHVRYEVAYRAIKTMVKKQLAIRVDKEEWVGEEGKRTVKKTILFQHVKPFSSKIAR